MDQSLIEKKLSETIDQTTHNSLFPSVMPAYLLTSAVGGLVGVDGHVKHLLGDTGPHIRDQRCGQVLNLQRTNINDCEKS